MKYLLPYMILFAFVTLQGFGAKQDTPEMKKQQAETPRTTPTSPQKNGSQKAQNNREEFDDEFEEEFKEKETSSEYDPISGYNRSMTSFNDKVIIHALQPVSKVYATVVPQPLRVGVSNFIHNIEFPIRLVNNLLQLKFKNSYDETERFLVNSTIGLAGVMDPATKYLKIPRHNEDFGQTLGHYGVGPGFHIVLPFLGPSNVRDVVGITLDAYVSPLVNLKGWENYKIPDNFGQSIGIATFYFVNDNSLHPGDYESIKKDAIDLYPFLRDIYEQKRVSDIAE